MAFRVAGAIGAVAVELRLGLLQDLRARFARAFAMSVDVLAFRELDVDGLRVLAAERISGSCDRRSTRCRP